MKKRYNIKATALDSKGRVLAVGFNNYEKSSTWQKELSIACGLSEERIYSHGEVVALLKAKNMRKKVHTLKVERYDSLGESKTAFPCISCQLAIKLSGVKRVLFTTENGIEEWIP